MATELERLESEEEQEEIEREREKLDKEHRKRSTGASRSSKNPLDELLGDTPRPSVANWAVPLCADSLVP